MAADPRAAQARAEAIANIERTLTTLRQTFATGNVPVDEEVRIRAETAEFLIQSHDQLQQPRYLDAAIEHLETVLRRVPADAPGRARYLNRLSYAKMTVHMLTSTRRFLDQAVRYGLQAREAAEAAGPVVAGPDAALYLEILSNYGFALSHRYALAQRTEDLDEAIVCARRIIATAPRDSQAFELTLNNLASRLRMRYGKTGNASDIDEAIALVEQLLALKGTGTAQYAAARGQMGMIVADKYNRTKNPADLDEALGHCVQSIKVFPAGAETRVDMLRQVVQLYEHRYRIKKDPADQIEVCQYSEQLFRAVPASHSARGQFLLSHALHLQNHLFGAPTLALEEKYVSQIQVLVSTMPQDFPEKFKCQSIMVNMFGQRYVLTRKLGDLRFLADYIKTVLEAHNHTCDKMNPPQPRYEVKWLADVSQKLRKCCNGDQNNATLKVAEAELHAVFENQYRIQHAALDALITLCQSHEARLQIMGDAIQAGRVMSKEDIDSEERSRQKATAAEPKKEETKSTYRPPEYKTELGLRKLAVDPQNKSLVMDLSGFMESMLGYDPTVRVSAAEFVAREARMEQQAIEEARREGRHPNLDLCRMCRDLAKPIQLGSDGFQLTAKGNIMPHGNHFQLQQRRTCVVCRLIMSLITTQSGQLHPRLEAVDREIQGTRMASGNLASGEQVMRIDYGMRQIGELRLLTPTNYRLALRQGWQADTQTSVSSLLADRNGPVLNPHGQQINLHLVKSWLNICDHSHGSACNTAKSEVRADQTIPMIFIDAQRQCLVAATSGEKYFALSYVWGRTEMHKTEQANVQHRQQPGSLAAVPFPKTIRDAMTFVRGLGERYLWVDAICLVQDDKAQMQRDIPRMDIVYGRAFATLVALGGEDADAGLPGVNPGTRPPQLVEHLSISDRSPTLDDNPHSSARETLHLIATPRPLHLTIELSKWNSRGWILQERLLSRRCLFFAPDAMYFQCGLHTRSEAAINEPYVARLFDSVNLDDAHVLHNADHPNPLSGLAGTVTRSHEEQRHRTTRNLQAYCALVETYSKREFSFKADILNGFAGMFAVLGELLLDGGVEGGSGSSPAVIAGLPAEVFAQALLWAPAGRLPRRGARLPVVGAMDIGKPDRAFPSWSWAGWDGPVEYRLFDEPENGKVVLPKPMIEWFEVHDGADVQKVEVKDYVQPESIPTKAAPPLQDVTPITKPDQPDRQVLAKIIPDPDRNSSWCVFPPPPPPLQPNSNPNPNTTTTTPTRNILRFRAPTVPLTAFQITPRKEYLSTKTHVHVQGQQAVRRIVDRLGRHCGLWWEQAGYGYVGMGMSAEAESKMVMAGVSVYGEAFRRLKGPSRVEGEIRIFDDEVFPAIGLGSGLVNVLVVDQDMGHEDGVGDRCTVAVIHRTAWEEAGPRVEEVRVA